MEANQEKIYTSDAPIGMYDPRKLKILIVDSGKVTRNIIASEFSISYCEIQEIAGVEEASRLAKEVEFDLITLGVYLEGGTGFELCAQIRGIGSNRPTFASSGARILFVTSDFTEKNRIIAHDSGADGFIEKSADLATFKASISTILQDLLHENKNKALTQKREKPLLNQRVLIVDDSELNLVLFRRLLESQGAAIHTAISAEHALTLLESIAEPLTAVFSDLYMPKMNGDELCHLISKKEKFKKTKLGITTAAEESTLAGTLPEGVKVFSKPYRIEDILAFLT